MKSRVVRRAAGRMNLHGLALVVGSEWGSKVEVADPAGMPNTLVTLLAKAKVSGLLTERMSVSSSSPVTLSSSSPSDAPARQRRVIIDNDSLTRSRETQPTTILGKCRELFSLPFESTPLAHFPERAESMASRKPDLVVVRTESEGIAAFEFRSTAGCDGLVQLESGEQQRERYKPYIEKHIGEVLTKNKLCVFAVDKDSNILSTSIPGQDIELVGGTDLLVLDEIVKTHPITLEALPRAKMLIEVKKDIEEDHTYQVISELIALDVLTEEPVMALLTNLVGVWKFFWFKATEGKADIACCTLADPSEAFAAIRSALGQSASADADIELPFSESKLGKRSYSEVE